MKNLFLSGVILLLAISMNAQGNLQFNKVYHLTYQGSSTINNGKNLISNIIVPKNKVWKIESGSVLLSSTSSYAISNSDLIVDKQVLYGVGNSGSSSFPVLISPIWLGEGNYIIELNNRNNFSVSFIAAISVLEFNIVP